MTTVVGIPGILLPLPLPPQGSLPHGFLNETNAEDSQLSPPLQTQFLAPTTGPSSREASWAPTEIEQSNATAKPSDTIKDLIFLLITNID